MFSETCFKQMFILSDWISAGLQHRWYDVFYLRTVLWKVKPGQCSRCLCASTSASASPGSFKALWLQQRLPVSRKTACSLAAVWHVWPKSSGYDLKGPVLVPGPWQAASEGPSDSLLVWPSSVGTTQAFKPPLSPTRVRFPQQWTGVKTNKSISFLSAPIQWTLDTFSTVFCLESKSRESCLLKVKG